MVALTRFSVIGPPRHQLWVRKVALLTRFTVHQKPTMDIKQGYIE